MREAFPSVLRIGDGRDARDKSAVTARETGASIPLAIEETAGVEVSSGLELPRTPPFLQRNDLNSAASVADSRPELQIY